MGAKKRSKEGRARLLEVSGDGGIRPTAPELEAVLGARVYAEVTNYGFSLFTTAIIEGDVVIDDQASYCRKVHRQLGSPGYLQAFIFTGDLECRGRLDLVLGTARCEAFVDHSDASFFANRLIARHFISGACSGADVINRLETPFVFEWDYPQIRDYGANTTIFELSGDDLEHGNATSTLIVRDDFAPRLAPDLLRAFADPDEYPDAAEQFWAICNDLDDFIDAVERRFQEGLPILRS